VGVKMGRSTICLPWCHPRHKGALVEATGPPHKGILHSWDTRPIKRILGATRGPPPNTTAFLAALAGLSKHCSQESGLISSEEREPQAEEEIEQKADDGRAAASEASAETSRQLKILWESGRGWGPPVSSLTGRWSGCSLAFQVDPTRPEEGEG